MNPRYPPAVGNAQEEASVPDPEDVQPEQHVADGASAKGGREGEDDDAKKVHLLAARRKDPRTGGNADRKMLEEELHPMIRCAPHPAPSAVYRPARLMLTLRAPRGIPFAGLRCSTLTRGRANQHHFTGSHRAVKWRSTFDWETMR